MKGSCYNILMVKPDFRGQADDEEVQFIFHRHWSVMAKDIFMAVLIGLVSTIPTFIWHDYTWSFYFPLAGLVVVALVILNTWLKWYFTIYIVTDQRIRQQLQQGLFKKVANDVYLDKVLHISYNVSGLFGSLLGYGNMTMQTSTGDMIMTKVEDCEDNYNRLAKVVNKFGGSVRQDNRGEDGEE